MKAFYTDDGRYYCVEQEDHNLVVYELPALKPVWDRWSYEFNNPSVPPTNPIPSDIPSTDPSIPIKIASGVNPIGMSYWRNINNHGTMNYLQVFLSIDDELVLFTILKSNLQVIDRKTLGFHHTGEGCYFSAIDPSILFIPWNGVLYKVNVNTDWKEIIWSIDGNLWQCHSNYYENTHSATIKDSNYNTMAWGVKSPGKEIKFPLKGAPDECQIDKSGNWLLIKENNYNRIIHLPSGSERIIQNEEGALGHSDCGFGCMIGENDFSNKPGALDFIDLNNLNRMNMFSTGIWNMGYVSFTNAKEGPIENQFCLVTTPTELWKVQLDGSGRGTLICPNLTESQEYNHRPKANLCPLGEYAIWTSYVGGSLDAYIVRLP